MSAIRYKKYGFTIVELIVVISVIAILATIVIVSYRSTIDDSQKTLIRNNLSAISKSIQIYRTQNGHYPANATELYGGDEPPVKKALFSMQSDPYRWVLYCTNNTDFVVAGRQDLKTGSWWAAIGSDMDLTDDAPAGVSGSTATTCPLLGIPSPPYATWIKSNAGWSGSLQ